jgi:hypothetical protein
MVDLPDHDGPMSAVFLPPANTIFIFLIADSSFSWYANHTFLN